MENDRFLKLTNTVYKVLDFFPESDPLKNRAKDKVLSIMEHLVLINETSGWTSFHKEKIKVQLTDDIDALLGYLWIGKSQGWLNSANCLIIANEYEKIKKEIKPIAVSPVETIQELPPVVEKPLVSQEITQRKSAVLKVENSRQGQILDFLSKNERAQVMDLQKILPSVTKRTIRRDLDELLDNGKIIRTGDFNKVSYQLKR